ncbi:TVP38/TMEM64 family protein [Halomonas sp. PR-M31]|uniref:TVP38/TMEM64 family protein n=1 Tax=Halomonas sp. PR-M31 TaxID=1471202 RepID=UPI0006502AC3|nr:VTT domain-containing protein [Halomonas sp. PR-M31]
MSRQLIIVVVLLVVLASLGLLWQWLAMHDVLTAERLYSLVDYASAWRDSPLAILVVTGVYVLASLVMFPLSILVAVTGLLFGPWWGFGYSLVGSLATSVATFWLGHRLGRDALLRYGGQRLNKVARLLAGRGIRTMTLINLLPLAPFTLTNMLAGAFHLKFRDYMLGSLIGIIPGLIGISLLGSQLGSLFTAGNRSELLYALGGIVLAVIVLIGLKRYSTRKQRSQRL